jgi:hypothetical protein
MSPTYGSTHYIGHINVRHGALSYAAPIAQVIKTAANRAGLRRWPQLSRDLSTVVGGPLVLNGRPC